MAKRILKKINRQSNLKKCKPCDGTGDKFPTIKDKLQAKLSRQDSSAQCPHCGGRGYK